MTSPVAVAPTQRVKVAPSAGVATGRAAVSVPLAVAVMMVPLPRVDAQMPLPLVVAMKAAPSAGERYRSVPLTLIFWTFEGVGRCGR